ncbi:MAG: EsaB/YukD family protein [Candidatus Sericytochromatia bacterium]|nr:EsaB/YukD family protein [Candidatus Sericytochromatia bacterium]
MDDDVITVTIRTLDKSRQAEVRLPIDYTVDELIEASRQNWRLPRDTDFMLRCSRLGRQLPANGALGACGVQTGDLLEVVPLLEAGG